MKQALFYKKLENKKVQCHLCPNECIIPEGKTGSCKVRHNKKGILYSLVYGLPCATGVDPVEKKPLFHFMPGTLTYSIATAGCNLKCRFCQNWEISQKGPDEVRYTKMSPQDVVDNALANGCKSISYTYVEPAIFYEYILDIAKLARKAGLKNIMVTNAYLNPNPVKKLYRYIDACNIDLKGFSEKFYREICAGKLKPILDNIKTIHKMKTWLELTTMIIPGFNDDKTTIRKQCRWIRDNTSPSTPVHFSRFFPHYRMMDTPPTPPDTLQTAYRIAKEEGLEYVYIGNIELEDTEDTFCPNKACGKKVIERSRFFTIEHNSLKKDRCPYCGTKIEGVF